MNRKERRSLEKQLGINKMKKNLSYTDSFKRIAENQARGKEMQEKLKENIRISIERQKAEKENSIIAHKAEFLVKNKNISMSEAIDIVSKEIKSKK